MICAREFLGFCEFWLAIFASSSSFFADKKSFVTRKIFALLR
ncbi:hypothetical protein [Campylobacter sp.]|nr:hypothetical protein [Campylobacter sp.]MDY2763945.1 hypothetical protein [Campylobacter sp.]